VQIPVVLDERATCSPGIDDVGFTIIDPAVNGVAGIAAKVMV
jgi:hypothetical protein